LREVKLVNLKLIKLGNLSNSSLDHIQNFRGAFNQLPRLKISSITISQDLKDHELVLTSLLPENKALNLVSNYSNIPKIYLQQPSTVFFTETILLQGASKEELLDIYRDTIVEIEQKYPLEISANLCKLWPSFTRSQHGVPSLESESKETLLARYLIAYSSFRYTGLGQIDIFHLLLTTLMPVKNFFEDGLTPLHKIILGKCDVLVEEYFKLGQSLNVLSSKNGRLYPGR
jgi:hypothetical protein